jgi:hypothetical protein
LAFDFVEGVVGVVSFVELGADGVLLVAAEA